MRYEEVIKVMDAATATNQEDWPVDASQGEMNGGLSRNLPARTYRLPAGMLTGGAWRIFALLYFGFTWQTQPAATMWNCGKSAGHGCCATSKTRGWEVVQRSRRKWWLPDIVLPSKRKSKPSRLNESLLKRNRLHKSPLNKNRCAKACGTET